MILTKFLKKSHFHFLVFLISLACNSNVAAQVPTTNIVASYSDIDDSSNDYSSLGTGLADYSGLTMYNMSFTTSTTINNNLVLSHVEVGADSFYPVDSTVILKIRRHDNAAFTGDFEFVWFERNSFTNPNLELKPAFAITMEDALNSRIINRGTDNVFKNFDPNNGNNIERLDYVFVNGVTPEDAAKEGILLFERNGNDNMKIAPILAIDGSNDPSSFGNLVTIGSGSSVWGSSSFNITSVTFRDTDASSASSLLPNANIGSQNLKACVISLASLGISSGTTIYGYALFAGDVTNGGDSANLLDWTNTTYFPQSTGDADGGSDLIGGGLYVKASPALPVDISTLKVSSANCKNIIEWETQSEINFKEFEIERSINGKQFSVIGKMTGKERASSYRFEDSQPYSFNYYRLKLIDHNESFSYTDAVYIQDNCQSDFNELLVLPNPITKGEQVFIQFNNSFKNPTVYLYDLSGKLLISRKTELPIGKQMLPLRFSRLNTGVYFIRVEGIPGAQKLIIK